MHMNVDEETPMMKPDRGTRFVIGLADAVLMPIKNGEKRERTALTLVSPALFSRHLLDLGNVLGPLQLRQLVPPPRSIPWDPRVDRHLDVLVLALLLEF
jgi:hypothetical protein